MALQGNGPVIDNYKRKKKKKTIKSYQRSFLVQERANERGRLLDSTQGTPREY